MYNWEKYNVNLGAAKAGFQWLSFLLTGGTTMLDPCDRNPTADLQRHATSPLFGRSPTGNGHHLFRGRFIIKRLKRCPRV